MSENLQQAKAEAIKLWNAGHRNYAEIARLVGVNYWNVWQWIGAQCNVEQWEQDRLRHEAFFGGLTPQQEYDQHTKRRKELNDGLEDEML